MSTSVQSTEALFHSLIIPAANMSYQGHHIDLTINTVGEKLYRKATCKATPARSGVQFSRVQIPKHIFKTSAVRPIKYTYQTLTGGRYVVNKQPISLALAQS